MVTFHYRFGPETSPILEQSHVRAESLWHLLGILSRDCRDELDEATELVITEEGHSKGQSDFVVCPKCNHNFPL